MSKLVWDLIGTRTYETGVDHGVLFPMGTGGVYAAGVAWNGLTAVTESPSGAEANPQYADNIKYLNLISAEDFGGTIEAFTYPEEFEECDGSASLATGVNVGQQTRKVFGMCYRTNLGNDTDGQDHGYKLHLIYNALAAPSEKGYQSINDSPEAIAFSWEFTTTPIPIDATHKPAACITIDSTKVDATKLASFEEILYGKDAVTGETPADAVDPRLPLPAEVISHFAA